MLDGRISITTPEGVSLLLTPAGPAVRAKAWLIDFVIWLCLVGVAAWILSGAKLGWGIWLLVLFISFWLYPVLSEVYFSGKTIGKHFLGLQVLRADGLPVSWRESSLRNLLLAADFLPAFYFTGLLCLLIDPYFRRLGDLVAGTQVVYFKKAAPTWTSSSTTLNLSPTSDANANTISSNSPNPFTSALALTPDQQRALIHLFEREKSLPIERLNELGDLAEPITQRKGAESIQGLRSIVAGLSQ